MIIKIGDTVKDKGEKGTVIGFHRLGVVLENGYGWRWIACTDRCEKINQPGGNHVQSI